MAVIAYRLIPKPAGGFHLGREGLQQHATSEMFPSDSLFSALFMVMLSVKEDEFVDQFLRDVLEASPKPLRLSSLFPYVGDIPLFPMPRTHVQLSDDTPIRGKQLKKLNYVSPMILGKLLAGDVMDNWLPIASDTTSRGQLLQSGRIWIDREEINHLPAMMRDKSGEGLTESKVWTTGLIQRVSIDRISNSSQIYQVGRTVFADGCGLWCVADVDQYANLLEDLLHILGDSGIGGERSAGYGGFTVEPIAVPSILSNKQSKQYMTLSRYNPTLEELEGGVLAEGASYELVDIGGWMYATGTPAQRRQRVRMIEAGSVINETGAPITGRVVDIRPQYEQSGAPNHPVYRNGIPLLIPVGG
jgi:CRISPR-associated protein Csm4